MTDISSATTDTKAALDELIVAAEAAESNWTTPRAPGKWSPSQVTEHVARTFDEAAHMVAGRPAKFPKMPFFVRPIFRTVFFKKTLKSGVFPKAKTFKAFDPETGPETPAAARERLKEAHERYLAECSGCASRDGFVNSSVFGKVPVDEYMQFTTMHTRHHRAQIPQA